MSWLVAALVLVGASLAAALLLSLFAAPGNRRAAEMERARSREAEFQRWAKRHPFVEGLDYEIEMAVEELRADLEEHGITGLTEGRQTG